MHEITVHAEFAAAHAILLPDGTREPLHGHNWRVAVTVGAEELDAMQSVMDFHDLHRRLDGVIGPWANRNLQDVEPFAAGQVNSTAEQVAWWIGSRVAAQLPRRVRIVSVSVTEAPGCVATWRPPSTRS